MKPKHLVPYTLDKVVESLEHQTVETILGELHGFFHGGAKESAEDIAFSLERIRDYWRELTRINDINHSRRIWAESEGGTTKLEPEPSYEGPKIKTGYNKSEVKLLEEEHSVISDIVAWTTRLKWKYTEQLMEQIASEVRQQLLADEEKERPPEPQQGADEAEWRKYGGYTHEYRIKALSEMNLDPIRNIRTNPDIFERVKGLYDSLVSGAEFHSQNLPEFFEGQHKERIQIYYWHWRLLTNQHRGSWKFFKQCPELREAYQLIRPYDPNHKILSTIEKVLDRL